MTGTIFTAALLVVLLIGPQTAAKPSPEPPKPAPAAAPAPAISDALKAKFFKAQALKAQADAQSEKIANLFQDAVDEMRKACGQDFTLQTDKNGDPVCAAKPPIEKK